ncbi:hypothetical protein DRQ36_06805 [bacterium]|nr:MAG: hypothetical protein DRQ36_06805 [bacterium]
MELKSKQDIELNEYYSGAENPRERKPKQFPRWVFSVIVPGLGQITMGKKGSGWAFLVSSLISMASGLYLVVTGYINYIDMVLNIDANTAVPDPREVMHITGILVFLGITVIIYIASIIHAVVVGRSPRSIGN